MPSDDLVLNVRQIAGYPVATNAPPDAAILMQIAGLGSAYVSISPADFVGNALQYGGNMVVAGTLSAGRAEVGSGQFSNLATGLLSAQKACIVDFAATWGTIGGVPIATTLDVAATVTSFNTRTGAISLWLEDILCAGGAPIYSPRFEGSPRAQTPCPESNSSRLATTAYVTTAIANLLSEEGGLVSSFNGRSGAVVLTVEDVTATNPPYAPLDSPNFSGNPTAPTAAHGVSDGQIATTAFVQAAVAGGVAGVASFNTRTGVVVLTSADVTAAGGALLASPVFTGTPQAPTATPGTSTAQLATTAYVMAAVSAAGYAPLASPAFTGVPTGPTAAPGVSTTQLATTAFVAAAVAGAVAGVSSFNGRTGNVNLIANDISAAGGAVLASPAFTGIPTAPTATVGTNTTQLATTAFVAAAAAGFAPINSPAFTGLPTGPTAATGISTTQLATTAFVMASIAGAGYAPINSPALTGTPTSTTAAPNDNSTRIATTAYVATAVAGAASVTSFNGRGGAVSLIANDVSAAGGALLASPALTGTPTAPTAAPSTNTTQLATTAFVMAQLAASGVTSFNGRAGVVTLTLADVTAAGGVSAAGPSTLTGATVVGTAGVTAPAGAVGEYLTNSVSSATILGSFVSVVSLTLGPGDWDVRGAAVLFGTGLSNIAWGLSTTANSAPGPAGYSQIAATMGNTGGGPCPIFRLLVTVSTVIYLNILGSQTGGGGITANAVISARRMH